MVKKMKFTICLVFFVAVFNNVYAQERMSIFMSMNYYLPVQPWFQVAYIDRSNAIDVFTKEIPEIGFKYNIDSTYSFNYSYGLNSVTPESFSTFPAVYIKTQIHSLYFSKCSRNRKNIYSAGYQFVNRAHYLNLYFWGNSKGESVSGPMIRIHRLLNNNLSIGLNCIFPVFPIFDILSSDYWTLNVSYNLGNSSKSSPNKLNPFLGIVLFQEYQNSNTSTSYLNNYAIYGFRYRFNKAYFLQFSLQHYYGLDVTVKGTNGVSNIKHFGKFGAFRQFDKINVGVGLVEGNDQVRRNFRSSLIWDVKKFNPNNPFKGVFAAVGVPFAKNFEFQLSSDFYFTQRRIWEYDQLQLGVFYHLK